MMRTLVVLGACFLALLVLWIPGLKYPIVSDTAFYALLGESLWQGNGYMLFGEPYAKHIPFHAAFSYPFVWMFGYSIGMKVSTLVAGWGVLLASYLLLARSFSRNVALVSVGILTTHHAFVLMTHLGSADLLFTTLFLFSVYAYLRARERAEWYLAVFVLAGLASLTRYNGVPLFLLFLGHTYFFRQKDFRSAWYGPGVILGGLVFGAWLVRNLVTFGSPIYSSYTSELPFSLSALIEQIGSNIQYYANPYHNLLPILFAFALFSLWRHRREHAFLIAVMCTAWVLTSFWTTQAMRFAFPGYPILIGFAVSGVFHAFDVLRKYSKSKIQNPIVVLLCSFIVITHASALCLYTYGECNAWFDRNIGVIGPDLGITPEGFYAWHKARLWIRENADRGATVHINDAANAKVWSPKLFREDIQILGGCTEGAYRITQSPKKGEPVMFVTPEFPRTSVVLDGCE